MKINPGFGPVGKDVKVGDSTGHSQMPAKTFSDVMLKQDETVTRDQLNRILQQISQQGDRLAKSMTVRELRLYKQLVKKFLEETARRGVRVKETKGWDRRGRNKRYKLLDEIDHELMQMAEEMLESEQGRLEILQKIGEIRGLLINLVF